MKQATTIEYDANKPGTVTIIDQRPLPHRFETEELSSVEEVAAAIKEMHVRGAPLIGVTAAFGMHIAMVEALAAGDDHHVAAERAGASLSGTRPTAVNLHWAIAEQLKTIRKCDDASEAVLCTLERAQEIRNEDIAMCRAIREAGANVIQSAYERTGKPVNVLTHCNAGWLACVRWGTATGPMYVAHERGIPLHIWVDETRPRNQGARLTAWELGQAGIPHTVIPDNTGGHLMQHGMVDLAIVGSDRTTRCGDVANKIGTYLKALAAKASDVPFYAAMPSSTIDWSLRDGVKEIPIEQRSAEEVRRMSGLQEDGETVGSVLVCPADSDATNYGFDVTPAEYVTGIITERGIAEASEKGLTALFPERVAERVAA